MTGAPTNLFLGMLSAEQRNSFYSQLEPVALPVRSDLFTPEKQPPFVHFLTSGMASVVSSMEDGNMVEVGLVGREGIPEALHLLGSGLVQTHAFMQIAGAGLRMRFADFQRYFLRDEAIRRAVLAFVQYQTIALSQIAACNRLHEIDERLARWLLSVEDLTGSPFLPLTQEFLSQMLGARRSTVTLVAGTLQRAGFIEYRRGEVHILGRQGLEETSCECYSICRNAMQRYLAHANAQGHKGLPYAESAGGGRTKARPSVDESPLAPER